MPQDDQANALGNSASKPTEALITPRVRYGNRTRELAQSKMERELEMPRSAISIHLTDETKQRLSRFGTYPAKARQ